MFKNATPFFLEDLSLSATHNNEHVNFVVRHLSCDKIIQKFYQACILDKLKQTLASYRKVFLFSWAKVCRAVFRNEAMTKIKFFVHPNDDYHIYLSELWLTIIIRDRDTTKELKYIKNDLVYGAYKSITDFADIENDGDSRDALSKRIRTSKHHVYQLVKRSFTHQ